MEHWDQYDDKREIKSISELVKNWADKYLIEPMTWKRLSDEFPPKSNSIHDKTNEVLFKYSSNYYIGFCNNTTKTVYFDNGWNFRIGDAEYQSLEWRHII